MKNNIIKYLIIFGTASIIVFIYIFITNEKNTSNNQNGLISSIDNSQNESKFNLYDVKLGDFSTTSSPNFSTSYIINFASKHILKYWPHAEISTITIKETDGYGRFLILVKFLKSNSDKTYSYSHNVIEIIVDESKNNNIGNTRIYLDEGTGATGVKKKSNWGTTIK